MPVYLLVRVPEQLAVVLLVLASMLVSMYRGSTIEALEPHVALVENAALLYCAPAPMGPAIALYYFIPPAIRPRAHEYVKKKN